MPLSLPLSPSHIGQASQLDHDAPGIPRLELPAYNYWSEGAHGVAFADEVLVGFRVLGLGF